MRIAIEHGTETKGLFRKETFYTVTVKVQFTEEEAAVLKKEKLLDHIVMERGQPVNRGPVDDEDFWHLRVRHLMDPKGNTYVLESEGVAQEYEEELKTSLKAVKAAIDSNKDVQVENKSYEL